MIYIYTMYKLLSISNITDNKKKLEVSLYNTKTKRLKVIKIGAAGMGDYTIFTREQGKKIADEHKKRYIDRHSAREDWTESGIGTAGFWSRWLLWNKPTLKDSIEYVLKTFDL
jgi:hypothetical protein